MIKKQSRITAVVESLNLMDFPFTKYRKFARQKEMHSFERGIKICQKEMFLFFFNFEIVKNSKCLFKHCNVLISADPRASIEAMHKIHMR